MSVQSYHLYYKNQLEKGIEFQDFVNSLLYDIGIVVVQYQSKRYQFERGENSGGIERTGNLGTSKAMLAVYFAYHNSCRIHSSIRCTPAMEAGISAHVWELRELLQHNN